MVEIEIQSEKKTFSPEKIKEYNQKFKADYPNDEQQETGLKIEDLDADIDSFEAENEILTIRLSSKIGYTIISIDLTKNTNFLIELIEITTKKLNKFKTILEAL